MNTKERKIQLTIRDVPEHIVIWLDIEAAKARTSREQLLRDLFETWKKLNEEQEKKK